MKYCSEAYPEPEILSQGHPVRRYNMKYCLRAPCPKKLQVLRTHWVHCTQIQYVILFKGTSSQE